MRVLVVHNRYRSSMPSGENRVVDDEVEMLRGAGVEVDTFFRDSDDIEDFSSLQKAALAISPTYNAQAVRDFKRVIADRRPDIVHLHNPFPLISPWVIRVAKSAGIPVVQTVHNYRHSCPAGTRFRGTDTCDDCVGKRLPWPAIRHGCYRGSRPQSACMALSAGLHLRSWQTVRRFLAVSTFLAGTLTERGLPQDRVTVKFNSIPDPGPSNSMGDGFLFAGRLGHEKGVHLLLDAWRNGALAHSSTLTIAGDGPLREAVVRASENVPGIRYVGLIASEEMDRELRNAHAVVIPSIWYEGYPTLAIEAFARGRPVIGLDLGSLRQILGEGDVGCLSAPDANSLAERLRQCDRRWAEAKSEGARKRYLRLHTPKSSLEALLRTFDDLGAEV